MDTTVVTTEWNKLPLVLSVQETAKILGIGRQSAYTLVHSTGFPKITIGRQIKVSREGLKKWLEVSSC